MMESVPSWYGAGVNRDQYSRHTVKKAKYLCLKCGTIFYASIRRPRCPKDNYGSIKRCGLGVQVNTSIVVGVKA